MPIHQTFENIGRADAPRRRTSRTPSAVPRGCGRGGGTARSHILRWVLVVVVASVVVVVFMFSAWF